MGCFGYICKGCGTSIRGDCFEGGELTTLIHVRDGQEIGRVTGHYNEYGGVVEQDKLVGADKFRGNQEGPNSHKEICTSELSMKNSYNKVRQQKQYADKTVDYYGYIREKLNEESVAHKEDVRKSILYEYMYDETKEYIEQLMTEGKCSEARFVFSVHNDDLYANGEFKGHKDFEKLPNVELENYSGVVAWHVKCYENASKEEQHKMTPSDLDPNQSWGMIRKKYR